MLETSVPTTQKMTKVWFDYKVCLYIKTQKLFALWVQKFLAFTKMLFLKLANHESVRLVLEALTCTCWCAVDAPILFKIDSNTQEIHLSLRLVLQA